MKSYCLIICLAVGLFATNRSFAQCDSANLISHNGGVISCNFPYLSDADVDYHTKKLREAFTIDWYANKSLEASNTSNQWKTKNLRVLLLTNNIDVISEAQIEKFKLAMNLHLVEVAKASKQENLHWSHMPIVEEIVLKAYPAEFSASFGAAGFLVFADPDERNGDTPLTPFVKKHIEENDINLIVNLINAPLDIPFKGMAQVYCSNPGPYMNIAIKKSNTIALSDKYLTQLALACVHEIGHTNFANHQAEYKTKEATNQCNEHNFAKADEFDSIMANASEGQKNRSQKSKAYGSFWSKDNANMIVSTYMKRGLLMPLFDYNSEPDQKAEDDSKIDRITLYPNPVYELLTIELSEDVRYKLSVFNINGGLIKSQQLESFITEMDFTNYDSGMYILEFFCESTGDRIVKKLEKVN